MIMSQLRLPGYEVPPPARRFDFVEQARDFARRRRGWPAFRFLRLFTGGSESDLDQLMGKIYCDALPFTYGRPERLPKSCLKSLAHPLYFAATKSWLWRRETPVDYDFETVDQPYFDRWYKPIYDALPGSKRTTPTPRAMSSVTPARLALLFLAPLLVPELALLSWLHGMNFVATYRKALGLFALYDGHFARSPSRDYLSYADDNVHPSLHAAFRRRSAGRLFIVQNGERTHHPGYAFASMDVYLAFGPYLERLARDLAMRVGRVEPIGGLYLNQPANLSLPRETRYDVLLLDQMIWPFNDFDVRLGRSFDAIFSNLGRLKRERPDLRVAYQLRYYPPGDARKPAVLAELERHFKGSVEILENDGRGVSYRNVAAARLVLTVNSTMGYEAFFLRPGGKALFLNYAATPYEIYSDDPRFQAYDPAGKYETFAAHVDYLLGLELPEPPACARERHAWFDGKPHERAARAMRNA